MNKSSNPVIIGTGQFTQHKGTSNPLDPLSLMVKTSQMAIDDTQSNQILDCIDGVFMININSWSYEDAPGELSARLGIKPVKKIYLPDGGHSPQMLVNRGAKAIDSGEHSAILITGGEAAYSIFKTFDNQPPPNWPKKETPRYMENKKFEYNNEIEKKYGLIWAPLTYAIFETALGASSGRSQQEHRNYIGKLFERFSWKASKNHFSWTQQNYTTEEIITPQPENRYINYPYTKRMCANFFVDQSASIIITSEQVAESLNIERDKWVYVMGGADLNNIHKITQRPRLDNSPAVREASKLALEQAGLTLKEIDAFDLYSCFPSIVEIIMNEVGIKEDDPRDFTITGGLPYFGAPLSNYSLHAIINAVNLIRYNTTLKIMIVANGGYNTNQSIGIYGSKPPIIPWGIRDDSKIQQTILEKTLPEPIEKVNGELIIDGYTIYYDRTGVPKRVYVIGTLEKGHRALAIIKSESVILTNIGTQELVGRASMIQYDSTIDRNVVVSLE